MSTRLVRLARSMASPRVAVLGDLMLDRYVWGRVRRVSPEAPVQILHVEREESRPGGAANVARNLATLGARTEVLGVVGRDDAGKTLARLVGARPVLSARPTTVKTRMLAHNQQMLRVDREVVESIDAAAVRGLQTRIRVAARACHALVISDYSKGTLTREVASFAVREFRRRHKPVIVGLKSTDEMKYRGATGAMLNREELEALRPGSHGGRALLRDLGLEWLVVTLGAEGLLVMPRRGRPTRFETAARQVFDVSGAGDTCLAAFALAFASGYALADCASVANAAAGVVVAKVGTATTTREEIAQHVLAAEKPQHRKILTKAGLAAALKEERARGRRIVFTNGCFDLLHPGHLDLLQFSREQGDVLVVGLNSDRSVRGLKGPGRPVMPQAARAEMLAALEAVDYVTVYDEPTPAALIRSVRPDVLVKGADWKGKGVVGSDFVERNGGRTVLAPLRPGLSSSRLMERVRRGR